MASITGMSTEDRLAIQELFARYAWACNTGSQQMLFDSFTEDCLIINPSQQHEVGHEGLQAFGDFMFNRPEFGGRQHYVGQLLIQGNGERCTVKSYCYVHEWIRGTETRQLYRLFWYDDVCVKVDGRWLFQNRHIKPWAGDFLPWKAI